MDDLLTVEAGGERMIICRTLRTVSPNFTALDTILFNGKPYISFTKDNQVKTVSMKRQNDQALQITRGYGAVGVKEQSTKIDEIWTLSADGRTLTVTRSFQNLTIFEDRWSVSGEFHKVE